MALTDVSGFPLKFVAEIDTSQAEKQGKKLKDLFSSLNIDTKPASKALESITNETKKTVTVTKDLTSAFDHLNGTAGTVHTNIAKARAETLALAQTERDLRKALKEKLVTDDEYIKKLALISKRRTELSDKLREYRDELKKTQVQETATTKPYTSADTAFEITNMHGGGGGELKGGTVVNPKEIERAAQANKSFASSAQEASVNLDKQATSAKNVVVVSNEQSAILETLKINLKEYKQLAEGATDPKLLRGYNAEIQSIETEIKQMSNAGKVGFDEMGNAIKGAEKQTTGLVTGLSRGIEMLRRMAYMIPGLGITGLMALAIKPISEYIKSLGKVKKATSESFSSSEYKDAIKNVTQLKQNIELANKGIISKDRVTKQYNETMGKVTGQVKSFNEASAKVSEQSTAYIQAIKMRMEAQALLNLSIDQTVEAQKRMFEGGTWKQKIAAAMGAAFSGGDVVAGYETILRQITQQELGSLAEVSDSASDAYEKLLEKSEEFNRKHGFNFETDDKTKKAKVKKTDDPLLKELEENLKRQAASFEKYEQFKTAVTEEEAKKRFAAEIGEFDSYAKYVQSELDGLLQETGTDDSTKFTESQKNRYDAILEASRVYYEKEKDQANQAFIEAYEATKDHNQRLLDIDEEYYKRVSALGESATMEQLDILDQSRKERISEEVSANLKIVTNWENTFAKMAMMSKKGVNKYLEDLRTKVEIERRTGKITADEYRTLMGEIDEAQAKNTTSFGRVAAAFKKYREEAKKARRIRKS